MRVCVVIPTYNEAKAIAGLIAQVKELNLEVVIVDDGSVDDTVDIALANKAKVLRNQVNCGKGAALIKGYSFALAQGFDAVITMDGDGQHAAGDLAAFIQKALDPSIALIVGNRMSRTQAMPWLRIITNRFMSWLISLVTKQYIPDTQCGFRLIKKEVLEKVNLQSANYQIESEVLIKAARLGFKIESIPIQTIYSGQKSQINPFIDTLRFIFFILREGMGISK